MGGDWLGGCGGWEGDLDGVGKGEVIEVITTHSNVSNIPTMDQFSLSAQGLLAQPTSSSSPSSRRSSLTTSPMSRFRSSISGASQAQPPALNTNLSHSDDYSTELVSRLTEMGIKERTAKFALAVSVFWAGGGK